MQKTHADIIVQTALDFANLHHRLLSRKGHGTPYLIHPLQVVDRMAKWGINKESYSTTWVVGLLHDTLEDTAVTLQEIESVFGEDVGEFIQELTFRDKDPEETSGEYATAKEMYLAAFKYKAVESLVVKISDRLCNVLDFIDSNPKYAVKYWNKANALFVAMRSRVKDIEMFYGESVKDAVFNDYDAIFQQIQNISV